MEESVNELLDEKSTEAKISHILSCVLGVMAFLCIGTAATETEADWRTRDAYAATGIICVFCSSTLWSLGTMVDNSKKQTILLRNYVQK